MVNIRKAAMIGCGFVGSSSAFALMQSGIFSEMVMIDVNREKAEGEAMDIAHGLPFARPIRLYAGTYDDIVDAAIIIITAGANQKPDETRLDLIHKNVEIYKTIIPEIAKRNCEGMLLIVSNPVDILTYTALKLSGFPENRVLGSGTVLDTARLKYLIGEHLKVDNRSVHAFIIGEHGDSELAAWSNANVSGVRLDAFCEMRGHYFHEESEDKIYEEVKNSAYEIIQRKQATLLRNCDGGKKNLRVYHKKRAVHSPSVFHDARNLWYGRCGHQYACNRRKRWCGGSCADRTR